MIGACSRFTPLSWSPDQCASCGQAVELHEPQVPVGALLAAAMHQQLDAALAAPAKPRAPLLLNLLACRPCGVERRFRLKDGRFACETCGAALDDAAANGPVPPPPLPSRDSGPAEQQNGRPAEDAAGTSLNRAPAGSQPAIPPSVSADGQARQAARPSLYDDPMWGESIRRRE